jgi:phosphate transport system substrate-binding protein
MSTEGSSIQRGARRGRVSPAVGVAIIAILAVGAGVAAYVAFIPQSGPEIVVIDGSSTVFPITSAWAAEFNNAGRQVVVRFSGTGGGFEKFCRGETDLNDASRPIKSSEEAACAQNGITGIEGFLVAYDGLSVTVNKGNDWVSNLTVKQLCRIWTANVTAGACGGAGPRVTTWSGLDPSWPNRPIKLYGPGTDSGTFDYFVEVILDPFGETITADFFASEDDNVLVQGIAGDLDGLGYFGYAYAIANTAALTILPIDDENPDSNNDGTPDAGPVAPTEPSVKDGSYAPLSRPLFVYGNDQSLARQVVEDYLRFGYGSRGQELVAATGYVTLSAAEAQAELAKL